jgi:hypothetical protein
MGISVRLGAALAAATVVLCLASCGDGGGTTGPEPEPAEALASFQMTVPDSIAEGEAFPLTVNAVGNRGTNPLTSYSGSVSLSTTLGTVSPSSLTVSSGTASGQVTLSTPGPQTLTASAGGRTGTASVNVTDLPDPTITGDPDATLEQAVGDSVYIPDPDDYSNDHPDLAGMYLSHNVVLMAFQVGTTVQQANDLLTPLGGQLVGGIQGVAGTVPSILIVKLGTSTHAEMEVALATLRASPVVLRAVQDALLSPDALPAYTGWTTPYWTWEWVAPAGGNWGMELIRVPQMWNLNGNVAKRTPIIWTGVIDTGFDQAHDDLKRRPQLAFNPEMVDDHGTHVAGIIGADYWDGQGMEGMNPFAGFVFSAPGFSRPGGAIAQRRSWGAVFTQALILVADSVQKAGVMNVSMGYNWSEANIDPSISVPAQVVATHQGALLKLALDGLATRRPLPVVTASAGNDSDSGLGLQRARYASPMCNAALEQGATNIIVVESVKYAAGEPGSATRCASSNVEGHISAPGEYLLSTVPVSAYTFASGTSVATAHVAGLVGYMFAVDPSLTVPQIRTALFDTSIPVGGGASNRIDAWAAVMEIDGVQGDDRVLKMMLDIDDGTQDGNQRVDYDDHPDFPDFDEEDADGDGGLGDGNVDMSDFRVWRDWYLKIWKSDEAEFDGREDHPKLDVNDNGAMEDAAGESLFPRGDFNGDGILSLSDSAWVGGAVQGSLTDLDVFKLAFDDPIYAAEDLDTLVLSTDFAIDVSELRSRYPNQAIEVVFQSYPWHHFSTHDWPDGIDQYVFTLPHDPRGYEANLTVGNEEFEFGFRGKGLGGDVWFKPIDNLSLTEKSTFYNTCDDSAVNAPAYVLSSLGLEPGDWILLDAEGSWEGTDVSQDSERVGVFAGSGVLETKTEMLTEYDPPKELVSRTIQDPIDAGQYLVTEPTKECDGRVTDIPHDFLISGAITLIQIPEGATHLFIGAYDSYYANNTNVTHSGGRFGVQITKVYLPPNER